MQSAGYMGSSNPSLDESSYMPYMSRTQAILAKAKRAQAIRSKVKDELEAKELMESNTDSKDTPASMMTIWDNKVRRYIK